MNGTVSVMPTLTLSKVIEVSVTDDSLTVDLEDGRTISIPVGWYPRLAYGTLKECANYHFSGAGHGIHWPDLDEDIGVEGLLLGKKSLEGPSSFTKWLKRREKSQALPP